MFTNSNTMLQFKTVFKFFEGRLQNFPNGGRVDISSRNTELLHNTGVIIHVHFIGPF